MEQCSCLLIPCICIFELEKETENNVNNKNNLMNKSISNNSCLNCEIIPCVCTFNEEPENEFITNNKINIKEPRKIENYDINNLPLHIQKIIKKNKLIANNIDITNIETDEYNRIPILPLMENTNLDNNIFNSNNSKNNSFYIDREIACILKPHQFIGCTFIYNNIINNKGCILADYMGLGKTIQMITCIHSFLVDSYIQFKKLNKVLILCPTICLSNWENEFNKWLTPESIKYCPIYSADPTNSINNKTKKNLLDVDDLTDFRLKIFEKWNKNGGILLLGYELYRLLMDDFSFNKMNQLKNKNDRVVSYTKISNNINSTDNEHYYNNEINFSDATRRKHERASLLYFRYLCNPGPDLVVLDEGHRLKDSNSQLCQSLEKIYTTKRVLLTGYPLQNCLSEYWCMVNFVCPNLLGDYFSFKKDYEIPILNGDTNKKSDLLCKLKDTILRRDKHLLSKQLPAKSEFLLFCHLTSIQKKLYKLLLDDMLENTEQNKHRDIFSIYSSLLQIINHPDLLNISKKKLIFDENDNINNDNIKSSGKMTILMDLIKFSRDENDKIVIFSQSVATLDKIKKFINNYYYITETKKENQKTTERTNFGRDPANISKRKKRKRKLIEKNLIPSDKKNKIMLHQITGTTPAKTRQTYINEFTNNDSNIKILLVSTRAGAEGINLHAANRLILFDVSWNPSHDFQAMCRSYRIGQEKHVYIYRLISYGTVEHNIFKRQLQKIGLSGNIVDNKENHIINKNNSTESLESLLEIFDDDKSTKDNDINKEIEQDIVLKKCLENNSNIVRCMVQEKDILDE